MRNASAAPDAFASNSGALERGPRGPYGGGPGGRPCLGWASAPMQDRARAIAASARDRLSKCASTAIWRRQVASEPAHALGKRCLARRARCNGPCNAGANGLTDAP